MWKLKIHIFVETFMTVGKAPTAFILKGTSGYKGMYIGGKELPAIYETNKKELTRLEGVYKIIYVLM
jgi:hypothetical protein